MPDRDWGEVLGVARMLLSKTRKMREQINNRDIVRNIVGELKILLEGLPDTNPDHPYWARLAEWENEAEHYDDEAPPWKPRDLRAHVERVRAMAADVERAAFMWPRWHVEYPPDVDD
jgi:hypothetical protein